MIVKVAFRFVSRSALLIRVGRANRDYEIFTVRLVTFSMKRLALDRDCIQIFSAGISLSALLCIQFWG